MNEELKKRLEGQGDLLDVKMVDGEISQLERTIEEPAPESSESKNLKTLETNVFEEGEYKELKYLCDQTQVKKRRRKKLNEKLHKILKKHDFTKEDNHYERVRGEFIDYLFLKKIKDNEGTFLLILICTCY